MQTPATLIYAYANLQAAIYDDEDAVIKPEAPKVSRRKTTGQDSSPPIITKLSTKVISPKVARLGDRASVSRKAHGARTEVSFITTAMAARHPAPASTSNFAHSPPPIPLQNRAVHPYFLRELLRTGVCPVSRFSALDLGSAVGKEATVLFAANRYGEDLKP